ncbi:fluconazole resistance protein [Purpureocillium lavendulum]|uniref:Fluconazole resistance protein n=1 Tax=Purpureocillium lavendulum TaxID=1247861 RepID=A0AB34FI40_9HYPO|nr:fluconazole resistance protein [Purpureocillium lavendulum]
MCSLAIARSTDPLLISHQVYYTGIMRPTSILVSALSLAASAAAAIVPAGPVLDLVKDAPGLATRADVPQACQNPDSAQSGEHYRARPCYDWVDAKYSKSCCTMWATGYKCADTRSFKATAELINVVAQQIKVDSKVPPPLAPVSHVGQWTAGFSDWTTAVAYSDQVWPGYVNGIMHMQEEEFVPSWVEFKTVDPDRDVTDGIIANCARQL